MLPVVSPFPFFTDADGEALDGGQIFIGVVNLNPETNPISVFWDIAGTQPAVQPIRTNAGFPVRSGTPSVIFVATDFSVTIRNRNGVIIFHAPNSADLGSMLGILGGSNGAAYVFFIQNGTGAVARSLQEKDREIISVTDFFSASQKTALRARTLGTDMTTAIQAAMDYIATGGKLVFPWGAYLVSDTLNPSNGTSLVGDNSGNTASATYFKFTGIAKRFLRLGVSNSAFNYSNTVENMFIELFDKDAIGISLNATVLAQLRNIFIQGQIANLATRTTIGFDIDGKDVSGFFNNLTNCRANHIHQGFVIRTTGGTTPTSPTQQVFENCSAQGDMAAGDVTSNGFNFINAGESTVMIGGDVEDCNIGIYLQGGASGPAVNSFGMRYENNTSDITNNSTSGRCVFLGSSTLAAAKVQDNSGVLTNTMQYGVAGTVAGSGLVVTAGQTIINGATHRISTFVGSTTGLTAVITATVNYTLTDNGVTIDFPVFGGTSNSTAFTITGMPAEIRPIGGSKPVMVRVVDNSGASHAGLATIDTGGVITLSNTLDAGGLFTAAGTKQLQSCSVAYTKA